MQLSTTPKKLLGGALKPHRIVLGLKYLFSGWLETPAPVLPQNIVPRDDDFRQLSFTFALIALCARVARAGGPLTQEKYVAFREAFPLSGGICGKIRHLFALACENPAPFEHYVTQIKHMFPHRAPLFSSLIDRLFRIASASGHISRPEERMLAKIAHMLELTPAEYSKIRERYEHPPEPHDVLGLSKRPRRDVLKKRYRELMRHYHPDLYAQSNVSPEVELLLQLKVSEINKAYRRLSKKAA